MIELPQRHNGHYGYSISTATDEDVENFVRDEVVAPVAFCLYTGHQPEPLV